MIDRPMFDQPLSWALIEHESMNNNVRFGRFSKVEGAL